MGRIIVMCIHTGPSNRYATRCCIHDFQKEVYTDILQSTGQFLTLPQYILGPIMHLGWFDHQWIALEYVCSHLVLRCFPTWVMSDHVYSHLSCPLYIQVNMEPASYGNTDRSWARLWNHSNHKCIQNDQIFLNKVFLFTVKLFNTLHCRLCTFT